MRRLFKSRILSYTEFQIPLSSPHRYRSSFTNWFLAVCWTTVFPILHVSPTRVLITSRCTPGKIRFGCAEVGLFLFVLISSKSPVQLNITTRPVRRIFRLLLYSFMGVGIRV